MSEATVTFKDTDDGKVLVDIKFDGGIPNENSPSHRSALAILGQIYEHEQNKAKQAADTEGGEA